MVRVRISRSFFLNFSPTHTHTRSGARVVRVAFCSAQIDIVIYSAGMCGYRGNVHEHTSHLFIQNKSIDLEVNTLECMLLVLTTF